jgi:hypothetical protein
MRKIAGVLGLMCVLVVSTGCFDIEQSLTLNKDLSGKAGFKMGVDMEPMVLFMAQMARGMEGKEGEPSAAEIEKAKKDFLTKKKTKDDTPSPEQIKADAKKQLPKGVELLDASVKDEGLKIGVNLLFGFDNVNKLSQIKIKSKKAEAGKKGAEPEMEEGEGGPGPKNPAESPFSDLQVKDEGKTILITSKPMNPAGDIMGGGEAEGEGAEKGPEPDADTKKMIEKAFKNFRIAFKISAPFEVVESNATRKEGSTLIWEYDLKSLEKMKPKQLAEGIKVRYKK